MEEKSELIGNKSVNRESAIRKKISEFVEYYESKRPYPENDRKLTDIELEACKLIAASIIQVNLDKTINDLGGYDKFVAKMCELAHKSALDDADIRIISNFDLITKHEISLKDEIFDDEKIDTMQLKFLSVEDTIKALLEEKNREENENGR